MCLCVHPIIPSYPYPHSYIPCTDVEELYHWHVAKLDAHPYYTRLSNSQLATDPCIAAMTEETEESKKVGRMGGKKFAAVYERRADGLEHCASSPKVLELWD